MSSAVGLTPATIKGTHDSAGVGALVLRIDSPGGDVRAGEAVRRKAAAMEHWGRRIFGGLSPSPGILISRLLTGASPFRRPVGRARRRRIFRLPES